MYQDDPKTSKVHTSPNNIAEFLFRRPFQPTYTKTYHIPKMVGQDPENREHSGEQDHQRNKSLKEPFTYGNEEDEEIPP